MKYIIGKKLDMTQVWKGEEVIAVTRVLAGPCKVVQVKNIKSDGYRAVQLGFDEKKEKNINKPQKGHLKGLGNIKFLREFRLDKENGDINLKKGDVIDVNTFNSGDIVKVTGKSKGRGFAGVVKRYGFHGQDSTHGHKDQERHSGSIGAGGVQNVFKGVRMGGHMGDTKVTTSNLEVVDVDKENNILYIKGSVPGARNSLVLIYGEGELKINTQPENKQINDNNEETKITEENKKEEKTKEIKTEENDKKEATNS